MVLKANLRIHFCLFFIIILLLFSPQALAGQANELETVIFTIDEKSYIKGSQVITTDIAPYIKDMGDGIGQAMVPVAFLTQGLDIQPARWFPNDRIVVIDRDNCRIILFIDKKEMLINGKKMQMDMAPELIEIGDGGRTMVPIHYLAKALGVGYEWHEQTKSVYFYGKNIIYDQQGTYGLERGIDILEANVLIKASGVKLQNLNIKGNLIITEEVGQGEVYLSNITVNGEAYIRGGGTDSIYLEGGSYRSIIIENAGGGVRVVATDLADVQIVIAEEAQNGEIILEGSFEEIIVEAPGIQLTTLGATTIQLLEIKGQAEDAKIKLSPATEVKEMIVGAKADISGGASIRKLEIRATGVTLEVNYGELIISAGVEPPKIQETLTPTSESTCGSSAVEEPEPVPTPTPSPQPIPVTHIAIHQQDQLLAVGNTLQLTFTLTPEDATNSHVIWESHNTDIATVDNNGLVTAIAPGAAVISAKWEEDFNIVDTLTINIIALSPSKAITAFNFPDGHLEIEGVINEEDKTIRLTVPYGSNINELSPTIEHTGVSITPNPGESQDFSQPVIYTVTAEDGSMAQYTVEIIVEPSPTPPPHAQVKELVNYNIGGVTFAMILAPTGTFPANEKDQGSRTVDDPFWIGQTEVTYELWHKVYTWAVENGYTFNNPGTEGSNGQRGALPTENKNEPVTNLSWYDAVIWTNALTQYYNHIYGTGLEPVYLDSGDNILRNASETTVINGAIARNGAKGFRLPTIAEWQLAARWQGADNINGAIQYPASSNTYWTPGSYASGAENTTTNAVGQVAWYGTNSSGKTQPVKGKAPNLLGLYDMSGNAWEWTFSSFNNERVVLGGGFNTTFKADSHGLQIGRLSSLSPSIFSTSSGFRLAQSH